MSVERWKPINKHTYKKWTHTLSKAQESHMINVTSILVKKGVVASFHALHKHGRLTLYYLEFWRRMVLKLVEQFDISNPCYKLHQIHNWVLKNPNRIPWEKKYDGIDINTFLFELREVINDCSSMKCPSTLSNMLSKNEMSVYSKKTCYKKGGCWSSRRKKCYRSADTRILLYANERKIFNKNVTKKIIFTKWMKSMVHDAVHGTTYEKRKSSKLVLSRSKKSKDYMESYIRQAIVDVRKYTSKMTSVVIRVAKSNLTTEAKKEYINIVKKIEKIGNQMKRCQVIFGRNVEEVYLCIKRRENEVRDMQMTIDKLYRSTAHLTESQHVSKWSVKWMIGRLFGVFYSAFQTIISPVSNIWKSQAEMFGMWKYSQYVQLMLLGIMSIAFAYGVISWSLASTIVTLFQNSFTIIWKLLEWWCNSTFIVQFLLFISICTISAMLSKPTKENDSILKNLFTVRKGIMFISLVMGPLCKIYNAMNSIFEPIRNAMHNTTHVNTVNKDGDTMSKRNIKKPSPNNGNTIHIRGSSVAQPTKQTRVQASIPVLNEHLENNETVTRHTKQSSSKSTTSKSGLTRNVGNNKTLTVGHSTAPPFEQAASNQTQYKPIPIHSYRPTLSDVDGLTKITTSNRTDKYYVDPHIFDTATFDNIIIPKNRTIILSATHNTLSKHSLNTRSSHVQVPLGLSKLIHTPRQNTSINPNFLHTYINTTADKNDTTIFNNIRKTSGIWSSISNNTIPLHTMSSLDDTSLNIKEYVDRVFTSVGFVINDIFEFAKPLDSEHQRDESRMLPAVFMEFLSQPIVTHPIISSLCSVYSLFSTNNDVVMKPNIFYAFDNIFMSTSHTNNQIKNMIKNANILEDINIINNPKFPFDKFTIEILGGPAGGGP